MLNSLLANVPTPPSTFDGVTEAIAVFVLLLVFVMLRQALLALPGPAVRPSVVGCFGLGRGTGLRANMPVTFSSWRACRSCSR